MQIANGIVIVAAGNHEQPVYGITPAEAVILHKLHFANAKGNPLKDIIILSGQSATTQVGSKREKVMRPNLEGEQKEVEINVPILKPRTDAEELHRLKRAYYGTVKGADGKSAPVVNVCFPGTVIVLPKTFKELEGQLEGVSEGFFKEQEAVKVLPPPRGEGESGEAGTTAAELEAKRKDLMKNTVPELKELAKGMEVKLEEGDTKPVIVEKILAASQAAVTA